jgi:hypothetical protein
LYLGMIATFRLVGAGPMARQVEHSSTPSDAPRLRDEPKAGQIWRQVAAERLAATGNSFPLAALTSEAGPWMEVHDAKQHFQGGDSGAVGIVPRRFRFCHG